MFGPFKPSAPLFGGLLWKIPWRLSGPQKLRHRRRLRRVDNVVAVLDTALQRQAAISTQPFAPTSQSSPPPTQAPNHLSASKGQATPDELATTAEGRRLLEAERNADLEARRNGKGPKRGDWVPEVTAHGVQVPSGRLLSDEARLNGTIKLIERWKAEMPTEQEMLPRDKYTVFNRYSKGYRKGIHKVPKWTRISQRLNPPGF
ncbi:mitochondrial ribosomal protein L31-domain-containing protein [Neohortaea acidophila]|uniref:Mitochondrial ribosomal protein L31-domain-containing protein n=1 Tax=Neohortaea acidophila TaxID=245834 RepID=A0A6A6Q0A2_9PEZI|nr:mitochondrial ribosomal protein L31-domain-containing protein [Neohortaea acidophila]KAF2485113.1 mitochondrial ribosomal protein L31-domain-containing protein [Neohortaea acidophila]